MIGRTVWVRIYEHCHGDDVSVYATRESAWASMVAIVDEWWNHEIGEDVDRPDDDKEAVEFYFDHVEGEYWSIRETEVQA